MSQASRVLIVDDDPDLRDLLSDYLSRQDMVVSAVGDGEAMNRALAEQSFDILILDLMLPGADGLTLCRDLRSRSNMPILMLTARGDELDRIIGLEMGADDYLPKPFNPRELLARVRSILRRVEERRNNSALRALQFGDWRLELGAQHLVDGGGVVTPLSGGEFKLMQALAENPQRVMSRDQLMEAMNGKEAGPFDRTVDVMIGRLRRRLGDDAREPLLIKTIRSGGYMLACEVVPVR
ncbi:response regulator [Chromobacterium violaceum]|uniref:DNA-binding response regulator n=3 Tax=Chromobacterium violaceum TaxID=536 RepID=A0A1R0MIS0_CHRVL|nr:response regulator [Chromobacterium violaceum]AAQ60775.1 probable two-component response regulator [Chromobacterium violaceum ATCC 12472]ATP29455.1 DNA-binding response regulator [Chromobacterium violaceum]ATP33359.1 DNA-binding response regulator [Chromobacterium violaceum]KJH68890.1 transcriptional regulator [Chromobacterium violaceum]KMN47681.1 transcriptional regulator [Chromobacterium violaceum]